MAYRISDVQRPECMTRFTKDELRTKPQEVIKVQTMLGPVHGSSSRTSWSNPIVNEIRRPLSRGPGYKCYGALSGGSLGE